MSLRTAKPISAPKPTLVHNLYDRVQIAFSQEIPSAQRIRFDAKNLCDTVTQRLLPFGVPFLADHNAAITSAIGDTKIVCLSGAYNAEIDEVAEYVARAKVLWAYAGPVTIALAMAPAPKKFPFDRALTMQDINSGVTYRDEGLIIIFRDDADFWKVVMHECIHLFCGERDEAITECKALLAHTMVNSTNWADFQTKLGRQLALSRANRSMLDRADAGATNAKRYWQLGEDMLEHAESVLAGTFKPSKREPQVEWRVSLYGNVSGITAK